MQLIIKLILFTFFLKNSTLSFLNYQLRFLIKQLKQFFYFYCLCFSFKCTVK